MFGHQYAMEFVRDNKLLLVVRAHEVMKDGYKKHWFGKEDRVDPLIITVRTFSYSSLFISLPSHLPFLSPIALLLTVSM